MVGIEGTLKDHLVPSPCSLQAAPWLFCAFPCFLFQGSSILPPPCCLLWQHFCPTEDDKYIKAVKAPLFWLGGGGALLLGEITSQGDGWLSPH